MPASAVSAAAVEVGRGQSHAQAGLGRRRGLQYHAISGGARERDQAALPGPQAVAGAQAEDRTGSRGQDLDAGADEQVLQRPKGPGPGRGGRAPHDVQEVEDDLGLFQFGTRGLELLCENGFGLRRAKCSIEPAAGVASA